MFVIFGNPVSHSKSPLMHNYFFKKKGINECYGRFKLEDGSKIIEKFKELKLKGANVTIPHKEWAFKLADEVRGIAQEIEAVNTLVLEKDKVIGYNTDAGGFFESVKEFDFKRVLIIGAGGSAKAVAMALKDFELVVVNRSKNRLKFFEDRGFKCFSSEELNEFNFDLVVNTTSAGLNDNSLPLFEDKLAKIFKDSKYAVDLIYKETPFLKLAKKFNLYVKDGKDMLIYQGILALEKFLNIKLNKEDTYEVYNEVFKYLL